MHILVVTNETAVGHTLFDTVADLALPARADVTVVAPALNSRHVGVRAHGTIGDANPLRAIEDELAVRDADQLVIATHPEHRSNWLELRLVERVRERYALPVLHVIVDLEQRRELLAQAA
jgi:hypothetical protein